MRSSMLRRSLVLFVSIAVAFTGKAAFARSVQYASGQTVAPTPNSTNPQETPPQISDKNSGQKNDDQVKKDEEKKDKKDRQAKKDKNDKKDKKSPGGQDVIDTSGVFNERIAGDVLGQIRDGLEGHSRRLMLSAFDGEKMDGYLSFEDQIDSLFSRYDGFRVHFRIANVSTEGTKGVILVDAELEETPRDNATPPKRKRSQLRFELELGRKGWKVVDFRDRNFFS